MKSALTIADAILKLSEPEVGDTVSNLKLQKLLYYIQGFHLALYGEPIFKEEILAWEHGPVVLEVYKKFKEHGSDALPVPEGEVTLTDREKGLVSEVWKVYGQFSAWRLRDMTHRERPWLETEKFGVISTDLLTDFFKTRVSA